MPWGLQIVLTLMDQSQCWPLGPEHQVGKLRFLSIYGLDKELNHGLQQSIKKSSYFALRLVFVKSLEFMHFKTRFLITYNLSTSMFCLVALLLTWWWAYLILIWLIIYKLDITPFVYSMFSDTFANSVIHVGRCHKEWAVLCSISWYLCFDTKTVY